MAGLWFPAHEWVLVVNRRMRKRLFEGIHFLVLKFSRLFLAYPNEGWLDQDFAKLFHRPFALRAHLNSLQ